MGEIVVGVDGSPGSVTALRWAIGEARRRGATLKVVHAWTYPPPAVIGMVPTPEMVHAVEEDAYRLIDGCVAEAVGSRTELEAEIRVERLIPRDGAAPALIRHSKGTDLVVVGSRGRGGFVGLLLGSVSQQVAQHAECPVVIIPAALGEPR